MGFPIEFEKTMMKFYQLPRDRSPKAISWIQDYMSGLNDIDFNGPYIWETKLNCRTRNYSGVVTNPSALGQRGPFRLTMENHCDSSLLNSSLSILVIFMNYLFLPTVWAINSDQSLFHMAKFRDHGGVMGRANPAGDNSGICDDQSRSRL